MMTKILDDLLACPRCHGGLEHHADRYHCRQCKSAYPIVFGVPDFRPTAMQSVYFDDPKEYATLGAQAESLSFAEAQTMAYGPATAFQSAYQAAAVERGDDHWREAESLAGGQPVARRRRVLDIGCSTGGYMAALASRFDTVVGIDVSMKPLIVARRRFAETQMADRVFVIAASADALPFRPGSFDYVTAMNVIEHVNDQPKTLAEAHRILGSGGALFFDSPNRFTLLPEPHVKLWGVSYLPRAWASPYVRLRKGIGYEGKRLLSLMELRRFLRTNFGDNFAIGVPSFEERTYFPESRLKKLARVAFNGVFRKTPVVREVLYPFVPTYNVLARK